MLVCQREKKIKKKDDGSCVYNFTDPDFDFTLDDESTYSINFDGYYYSESDNEGDTELHSSSYKNYANGYSNAVVYSSFISTNFSPKNFSISKGVLVYPGSWTAPVADFFGFFQPNTFPYAVSGNNQGIIISYTLNNGVNYISDLGDQTGSHFEILQAQQQEVDGAQSMKVLIKFNCKMYNSADSTDMKLITDGQVVTHFINF